MLTKAYLCMLLMFAISKRVKLFSVIEYKRQILVSRFGCQTELAMSVTSLMVD